MEKVNHVTGIKVRNSSNIKIYNSEFKDLDTAVDAKNVKGLDLSKNKIYKSSSKKSTFWKNWQFYGIIVPVIIAIIGWIWFS